MPTPPSPRARTPGIIRSLVAAIMLGAATTVAIAWGLTVGVNTVLQPGVNLATRTPGVIWMVREYATHGARTTSWTPMSWINGSEQAAAEFDLESENILSSMGLPTATLHVARPAALVTSANVPPSLVEHCRGWPMLALGCAAITDPTKFDVATRLQAPPSVLYGIGFRPPNSTNWEVDMFVLPLKPLFPGFYIDTVLFASLWWALLFWRPLRRRRRIARGLCPNCAYSLAGLPAEMDKCPECGTPRPTLSRPVTASAG